MAARADSVSRSTGRRPQLVSLLLYGTALRERTVAILCNGQGGRYVEAGLPQDRIVICGFSQGACLASEFVASNPGRYGALIAFTGGLIGSTERDLHHDGSLAGTPALFSSGDPDPHVPWSRVTASAEQFTRMGAEVHIDRHAGRPHTISEPEISRASALLARSLRNIDPV